MAENLRETGIDIIGDVPWGTHICQFYHAKEDLLDILVPYFRAGLENNEYCIWITAEPLDEKEAEKSMRRAVPSFENYQGRGQIEIIPYTEWYLKESTFDSQKVLNSWTSKLDNAIARGFNGLRATGNTSWLKKKDWDRFVDYEEKINNTIGEHRMMVLCTYSFDKCGPCEIVDVVRNHQAAFTKHKDKWEFIESSGQKQAEEELKRYREHFKELVEARTAELKLINEQLKQEIVERKKMEENLRFGSLLIANVTDSVFVHDLEGRMIYVNKSAWMTRGYTEKELLDMSIQQMDVPEYAKLFKSRVEQLMKTGKAVFESAHFKKDGTVMPVEVYARIFEIGGKKMILGVVRDIAEHKKAEDEIKKLNEDLERHSEELEVINKDLEAFNYSVTHDLRNPLTVIQGLSHLIEKNHFDELKTEVKDYFSRMKSASYHMAETIEDLLKLFLSGRSEIKYETVNLSEIVQSAVAEFKKPFPERQVEFVITPGISVKGDVHLFGIALENLLSNAWKFTLKNPGAKIEFGVMQKEDKPVYFIRDNGVGFDMANKDKLFIPFQRLHSEKNFVGSGIGLSIVKRIIDRHKGKIWAESEIGKGATFYFTLQEET